MGDLDVEVRETRSRFVGHVSWNDELLVELEMSDPMTEMTPGTAIKLARALEASARECLDMAAEVEAEFARRVPPAVRADNGEVVL